MKILLALLSTALISSAFAGEDRVIDQSQEGFIHIRHEADGKVSDHFIKNDQIVSISVNGPKGESGEISWVTIQTTAIRRNSDNIPENLSFQLDFKTREEAINATNRLFASMAKTGKREGPPLTP